jgi:hypothetical protein
MAPPVSVSFFAGLINKNSVSLGRKIGDCGLVCQGQTWHIMLGTRVFRGTGVCRAGMECLERKEEQARDLLRGAVLRGKGAETSLQATCRFPGLCQRSTAYMGPPKNEFY